MARISKKLVETRFGYLCAAMGWGRECWKWDPELGRQVAQVGAVYLDHNAIYGGYQVNQMVNDGGGIRTLTPTWTRYKPAEFLAWMEGVAVGLNRGR